MAILFDLDGTLFDTSRDIHTAVNRVLADINEPLIEYADLHGHVSFGTRKILAHALQLDPANNSADANYIAKLVPQALEYYRQTGFAQTFAYPGIPELLDTLDQAGLRWGIVTNKIQSLTEPLLKFTGHFSRAACIVCADNVPNGKPAPDSLLKACELLDIEPEKCIYIGDAATDIQAGKAAGMCTIAAAFGFVPDPTQVPDWQADYIAHTPEQIYPWIQAWQKNLP